MTLLSFRTRGERDLPWIRALLATVAWTAEFLTYRRQQLLVGLFVFLGYSIFLAARSRPRGIFALLALFADTIVFLVLVSFGIGRFVWLPSTFFMYLMVESLWLHPPREVLVLAVIANVFCALLPDSYAGSIQREVLIAGLLSVGFAIAKSSYQRRIDLLAAEAGSAREEALHAREVEAQRIASDFHDGPLQSFISLQMRLDVLLRLFQRDRQAAFEDLKQLNSVAQGQVQELRAFIRGMQPLEVDGTNLFASARRVTERFEKESGIPVTFIGGDRPLTLPPVTSVDVVQMLREALHNVQKHAGATRVAVAIEKLDGTLEVSVDDNGRGFPFSGAYTLEELELLRLGPASLKRRARSLNAELLLESRPGRGAGLRFRIPV